MDTINMSELLAGLTMKVVETRIRLAII